MMGLLRFAIMDLCNTDISIRHQERGVWSRHGLSDALWYSCFTFTIPGSVVNWMSLNGETGIEVPNDDDKAQY